MINLIKKLSKKDIFRVYMLLFNIEIIWSVCIVIILDRIIQHLPYYEGFGQYTASVEEFTWWDILIKLPIVVTKEEMLFRVLPMILWIICIKWIASDTTQKRFLVSIMIISSIVFGMLHGNVYNILAQGVGGFLYFFMFLIGYFKMKKTIYGVLVGTTASIIFHLFFDWAIIAIAMLIKIFPPS